MHAYWLLDRDIESPDKRLLLSTMLPQFYRSFGGDQVQNLSRLMRPPGTVNYKDARNRRPSVPCTLCTFDPGLRYPLESFSRWTTEDTTQLLLNRAAGVSETKAETSIDTVIARNPIAAQLVRQLEKTSRDRSRRDFAVVCDLLRLGLTRKQIWSLVAGSSKFETAGRRYSELTITNAEREVLFGEESNNRLRPST